MFFCIRFLKMVVLVSLRSEEGMWVVNRRLFR